MNIRKLSHSAMRAKAMVAAPLPLAALALAVVAWPAAAQEDPLGTPVAPEAPCVCAWEGDGPRMLASARAFSRPRIGVLLGEPEEVGGRVGIAVRDVLEGGPAARVGLRPGDILLSVNGNALGEEPARALLERLEGVEPGDTVTIGYSREGRELSARVVTERSRGMRLFGPGHPPEVWRAPRMHALREMVGPRPFARGGVADIELVGMNQGLGRYFDVSEGVLVADIPEDSPLGLRTGDVILAIGGREVRDPAHARAIIGSYRADEAISFEVVRDGRRATVSGTRRD